MKLYLRKIGMYFLWCTAIYLSLIILLTVYFGRNLPDIHQLERIRPKLATTIYSVDNQVLKRIAEQKRYLIPFDRIPPQMIDAAISTEDRRFWDHSGFDSIGILRAIFVDLKAMSRIQGASTLTQQLSRNLFLNSDINWNRKIREALTAIMIEKKYSKREILEMYFNQVYFGHGAWGVQAAAQTYFSKNVDEFTLGECALLIGMLKAPNNYSPLLFPERALRRRNIVLDAMVSFGKLSKEKAEEAKGEGLNLHPNLGELGLAPYFIEYVKQQFENIPSIGIRYNIYQDGLSIYTSLDTRVQKAAEESLSWKLTELQKIVDQRSGRTTAKRVVSKHILRTGVVQGALIAIDPRDGHILAMLGGRNFQESEFNRATQALRQPGSAFKPFVYTAAIDNGYRPNDIILDSPVTVDMPSGKKWQPENFDHRFHGPVTLRDALKRSFNIATVRLLMQIHPEEVVRYAKTMGIRSRLDPVPSLAMGTSEVTLIDLTSAFSVFPNNGIRVEPISIVRIVDKNGNLIYKRDKGKEKEVLRPETAAVMNSMLEAVINEGTGHTARSWYGFHRPAGGKTGTTDKYADAWFVGFTPQIASGVWIGFDQKIPLGTSHVEAAAVALPVWAKFMVRAHDVLKLPWQDFSVPSDLVKLRICRETGKVATEYCPSTRIEVFAPGTQPRQTCPKHTQPLPELEGLPDEKEGAGEEVSPPEKPATRKGTLQF